MCYDRVMDLLQKSKRTSLTQAVVLYLLCRGVKLKRPRRVKRLIPPTWEHPTIVLIEA